MRARCCNILSAEIRIPFGDSFLSTVCIVFLAMKQSVVGRCSVGHVMDIRDIRRAGECY